MLKQKIKLFTYSSIIILLLILSTSCSKNDKKIPITTSSVEARELYIKGISLTDRLRGQEAIEYFEKAIVLDSNFAMAYIGLAFSQPNANLFFENLQKAQLVKDKVSEGERLWIEASEAQVNNQTVEVRRLVEKMIKLYPDDERARNFLATTYFGTQDYKESIEHYLKALEINPKFSPVYNQLGYAYRFLQNYNEAEKMFQKYIELIPNDPNPYDSYGELLMQIGRFDESIKNYEKALSVNPYFTLSYLGIASNLNYKEEHILARNRLQKFLTTATTDTQRRTAYNGIIVSYIDEGNLNAAYKITEKMRQIAIEASDTISIINEYIPLSGLFIEMGKLTEAEEVLQKSDELIKNSNFNDQLKLNASNNIQVNFAFIDIEREKFADARIKADRFFKFATEQENPNSIRLANQLYGMIAFAEKEYETAIEFLRKSNQNNPYNIYRMALAYENLGDFEHAKSYFTKAAEANLLASRNYSYIRKKAVEKM